MRAALIIGNCMDLIDDHRLDITENRPAFFRREQNVQGLRRGHQNMRRPLQHRPTFRHERVAGPDRRTNLRHEKATLIRERKNLAQRNLQVFLDVVAESLQRGHIEHFCTIWRSPASAFRTSRSMQARNAARVLPDPVGAEISVVLPARIWGHPCS